MGTKTANEGPPTQKECAFKGSQHGGQKTERKNSHFSAVPKPSSLPSLFNKVRQSVLTPPVPPTWLCNVTFTKSFISNFPYLITTGFFAQSLRE